MSGLTVVMEGIPADSGDARVLKRQSTPRELLLRERFLIWAYSFVRLDPRYRIHRFFQGIAQLGELKLQDAVFQKKRRESVVELDPSVRRLSQRELVTSIFNMASVFTVWRPCSLDAIRKMMLGKGVGKGLDIKGKSAKFGRCSGYVPFLQIQNEEDKKKIDLLPRDARMRIFYTSRETRQLAIDTLTSVRDEMVETVDVDQDSMSLLRYSFADDEPHGTAVLTPLLGHRTTMSALSGPISRKRAPGSRSNVAVPISRERVPGSNAQVMASNNERASFPSSSYPRTIVNPNPVVAPAARNVVKPKKKKVTRLKSFDNTLQDIAERGPKPGTIGSSESRKIISGRESELPAPRPRARKKIPTKDSLLIRQPGDAEDSLASSLGSLGMHKPSANFGLYARRDSDMSFSESTTSLEWDSNHSIGLGQLVPRPQDSARRGALMVLGQTAPPIDTVDSLDAGPDDDQNVKRESDTSISSEVSRKLNTLELIASTSGKPLRMTERDSIISLSGDDLFNRASTEHDMTMSTRDATDVGDGDFDTQRVSASVGQHERLNQITVEDSDSDLDEELSSSDIMFSTRRHSVSGNPAEIATRRRSSNFGQLSANSLATTGSPRIPQYTASVMVNPSQLLRAASSGRRTSSVMEYSVASQRRQAWEMEDPSIIPIDDYAADGRFGIEVSERLFWEALVIREENHCQRWHVLHPRDKTHTNCNNDVYDATPGYLDAHTTRKAKENFAQKLMQQMVAVSENDTENSVIEWIHEEKCWSFVIVNKERFVDEVLWPIRRKDEEAGKTHVFPTKFSSFAGELRQCHFVEETTGTGYARFRHDLFLKDKPELCALIGSEHDTGRGSVPSLQDANFKALRCKPPATGGHRVVLFNLEDDENPLCPHNLLMAYEEHGRVVPVVSDFDGFLVGTKRIIFDTPLPKEQVEIVEGSILSAQEILEGNAMGDTWSDKWQYASRDHLGQNNSRINGKKKPKMPQFGYGDAKSNRLMEGVVNQLAKVDGAVRHGAECFNYVYPQEIDQTFLVISDGLGGKVRWKYIDSVKLHYFLSNCIDDGYAFPLNPKWVLCDPGWSRLYDQLWQSKSRMVQEALKVWFPPKIRMMISQIQAKHPTGLRFAAPGEGPRKIKGGLPCIAKFELRARKRNGKHHGEDHAPVELWIDRGSVLLFSKPELKTGLVCATNESCVPICGGVTQALTGAGGPELLEDVKALPVLWESSFGPVRCVTGSAKIVSHKDGKNYGNLDVSHVIYAVGPAYGETYTSDNDVGISDGLLRDAYRKSLECAKSADLEAVAFSLLSAGKRSSRWDPHRALRIAIRTICDYEDFGSLKEVHMCAFTAGEVAALESIAREFGLEETTLENGKTKKVGLAHQLTM